MRRVIFAFFFFSGAASLVYEVVWTRQIAILLGNTVYVVSMVLAAFMAGLAGGSALIGRWADRRGDHLRIYGALEIAAALYCLALPWIVNLLIPLFRSIYASAAGGGLPLQVTRAALTLLLLLIPSFMLGGTLPVLSKLVARAPGTYGEDIGTLYAANTVGAVLGAAGAGFLFIPAFGVSATLLGAAAVAVGVGILSLILNERFRVERRALRGTDIDAAPRPDGDVGSEAFILGLAVLAVSGFAAMAYEVIWTRLLTLLIGPSTYAFTVVLAAFIGGLAAGSALFGKHASRFRNLWLALGLLQSLVGVGMLILMNSVGWVYGALLGIMDVFEENMLAVYLVEIPFFFALLLVPTVFSGGTFPLVFQTLRTPRSGLGRAVGGLYAGNAAGAVAGSLVAGFMMIPALGIRGSLRLSILINLSIGLLLLIYAAVRKAASGPVPAPGRARVLGVLSLAGVALAFVLPGWSDSLLVYPPYEAVRRNLPRFEEFLQRGWRLLYYREGVGATVAVYEGAGSRTLSIEGKPDASTWSPGWLSQWMEQQRDETRQATDMRTMVLLGHLPMFCAGNREDVLVIGLASGVTVGAVEQHPEVRSVVCAEISPEVVEACSYFAHANQDALADPRLTVVLEDGRNHLLMNPGRYDVIISEPSNPWMPGSAKLFTREAFAAARGALKEGGVMCSWVEAYSMPPRVMRSIIRSFTDAFPHVVLFALTGNDCCLVGSTRPLHLRPEDWARRMDVTSVRLDLDRISVVDWSQLARRALATTESLRRSVMGDEPNTDDNSIVEFLSPISLSGFMAYRNWAWMVECDVDLGEFLYGSVSPATVEEFETHFRDRAARIRATLSGVEASGVGS